MPSLLPRIPSWGRVFDRLLARSGHGAHHSRPLPLSFLSGPAHFWRNSRWRAFVFIARLWLSMMELPAGCWRSRPFGRSQSSRARAVETPRTPAGHVARPLARPISHPHDSPQSSLSLNSEGNHSASHDVSDDAWIRRVVTPSSARIN
jgi:hypothetical protein